MFGTISSFSIYRSTQTTIEFNKNEQYPITHWMMMGLKGNGGYNLSDSNATSSQKKYQDKKDYNIKVIKKRLKDYGPIGYTKFLLNKQYYNTAAGDFDWKIMDHDLWNSTAILIDQGLKYFYKTIIFK